MDSIILLRWKSLFMLISLISYLLHSVQCENVTNKATNLTEFVLLNVTASSLKNTNLKREAQRQDKSELHTEPLYETDDFDSRRILPADENSPYQTQVDTWDREYRRVRFTRVLDIRAECQDDNMKISLEFNGTFTGLVYSAGFAFDRDCMYINGTGENYYDFYIQLNRCGTVGQNTHNEDNKKSPTKNFMWNTVTVQYNPLIEEENDEHFKVTCEYGYDFWQTVTFPFLNVEVATGNPVVFTLTPPQCYMEIRNGYGTEGNPVSGPVRVGDPLTLIIYMRSEFDGFDIVVNDCYANNGGTKRIQLIDEYGCPVDKKLISHFRGSWSHPNIYETKVYAYMKTFRFTGSYALYIECDVRMCHGSCPNNNCHWKNAKNVRKRSIDNLNSTINNNNSTVTLSDKTNLSKSLKVLEQGEIDSDTNVTYIDSRISDDNNNNNICLKTAWFAALLSLGCGAVCLLGGAFLTMYTRIRKHSIDKRLTAAPNFAIDNVLYMNHRKSLK